MGSANHRLETIGSAEPEISVCHPCEGSSVPSAMLAPSQHNWLMVNGVDYLL